MVTVTTLWHPNAKRVIIPSAPQGLTFTGGGRKLTWHTTEGSSADGAVGAYRASGVCPHFTIGLEHNRRVLLQHLPLNRAASALKHSSGPETNRANNWQVEIVGFAAKSAVWDDQLYHYLKLLAQFINRHCDVPMRESVNWRKPTRLSGGGFYSYSGHLGHMHAPGNDHTDPGTGFHIGKIIPVKP